MEDIDLLIQSVRFSFTQRPPHTLLGDTGKQTNKLFNNNYLLLQ